MREDLPTGTVTFLFTDVVGSTRLLHSLGPEAYADALAAHREALRQCFAANGGIEVDTQGDAFFAAFPTAMGAAHAATGGHAVLADGPIRVRIGLHTGTPTVTAEGYVGIDVHRGARVASLAHAGQTLVSEPTAALLETQQLVDLGRHRLKDFDVPVRLLQLGTEQFAPVQTPGAVDLPTPATQFLGRERELYEAVSLVLERDPRVLTILGPGGTGKTRFAIELARLLAEEADGATLFVPLAPLRDAALVAPTIGETLGAASGDVASIAARINERRTRVVLDNAEHLLPEAALVVASLIAGTPTLRLLVTSREALRVQGEVQIDLPPMVEDDAVELFLARARAVTTGIERTTSVKELCAHLDCLPLALELAAARTKLLSPEMLLERLGERLDLLRGSRDSDRRHATLRTTVAWSYDLLEPHEQFLFAKLSVFAAGWTLESAAEVCDADLDTLGSLLDKSLLRRRTGPPLGDERYWMLETIREFAAEQLVAAGQSHALGRAHAERMLAIARSAHLTEDDDEGGVLTIALGERDDLRAALDWATDNDIELALELAVALENFWNAHAPHEGMQRFDRISEHAAPLATGLRVRAFRAHGGAADMAGERERGERLYEEGLALALTLGDERAIAGLTHRLAMSALVRGDPERARELAQDTHAQAQGRFPLVEIPNYSVLGQLLVADGEVEGGTELVTRGAEMARERGWDWWLAGQLGNLLFLALDRGDLEQAEQHGTEALRLEWTQENRHWALYAMTGLARLALIRCVPYRAGLLWGAVETEGERARYGSWDDARADLAGPLTSETSAAFVAGRERGRTLDLWDAAAIAVELDQTLP